MSLPFRERNPVTIGAISIAVLLVALVAAFRADDLPLIGGGDTYYANFAEAGGLEPDDEVRIAGVRVGSVDAIELEGDHVKVAFKVDGGAEFGPQSSASIRVKTLLGSMYLAVEPAGSGQMEEEATIPVSRTDAPYDVIEAFSGLADTAEQIDTDQLAEALTTMAELTENTPQEFREALAGVSALSTNLAARDEQINTLLKNLRKVSGVLAERDQDVIALMRDADVLFRALVARREAVHNLLVSTSTLSQELTALVRGTRADLAPALQNLDSVVQVLLKNQENFDEGLRLLAPFVRVFANTLGNGPWFDTYIYNFPPLPQFPNVAGGGR